MICLVVPNSPFLQAELASLASKLSRLVFLLHVQCPNLLCYFSRSGADKSVRKKVEMFGCRFLIGSIGR